MAFVVEGASGIMIPEGVPTFPVMRCIQPPWNPNMQDPEVFQNLIKNIKENGFVDMPQLWPLTDPEMREQYLDPEIHDDGPYWLIPGGSHRWEVAVTLGMEEWPGIEVEHWSEDMMKFQNMRLNVLKGEVDPEKFMGLWKDLKESGYSEKVLKAQMGLVKDKEFKRLVKDTTDNLPPDVQKKVQKAVDRGDVNDLDDLQRVLNELFSKHGDTLPFNYMTFSFGGKTHLWVKMDRPVMQAVEAVKQRAYDESLDINRVFKGILKDGLTLDDAFVQAEQEADEEIEF